MSTYYKECFIEKIYHFDNEAVLKDIQLYTDLHLSVDNDEPFGDRVKIISEQNKDKVIGVLSKEDGKLIYDIIKNGWIKVFKAVVVKIDKDGGEDKTYKIVIKIERI